MEPSRYPLATRMAMAILAAAALMAAASSASAAVCGDREGILSRFADTYQEEPAIIGLTERGDLIEILRAPSGTWTLIATRPVGTTCIVMAGEALELLPAALPGEAS